MMARVFNSIVPKEFCFQEDEELYNCLYHDKKCLQITSLSTCLSSIQFVPLTTGTQKGKSNTINITLWNSCRFNDKKNHIQPMTVLRVNQLFGSMPRLFSSRCSNLLIHPDLLSSPSSFMAITRRLNKSLSSRSWTTWRSLFSVVDIVNSCGLICNRVDNVQFCMTQSKAKPGSVVALTGHLTTSLEGLTLWLRQSVPISLRRSTAVRKKLSLSCCTLRQLMKNQPVSATLPIIFFCLPVAFLLWEDAMSTRIDKTPITAEDLAFQCLALTHAAVSVMEADARETLLFILLEKTEALYGMLTEGAL
ncbi:hypothetical protein REG_0989 [Candidatus Regiella insecticola LSR1]|uniref:Uncharacterized protein n=2 Tax=Candidatus Regiella insecticola TaxID=138073 RepID=E0WSQ2_9ENTR|nr:hypothetical protein REG_0989 [Candidatus Regiella insecticola LSR1]